MQRILVTGALGQIGTELVATLREKYGREAVIASDVRVPPMTALATAAPFEFVDVQNGDQVQEVVARHRIDTIFHLAALLSATAEAKPQLAWELNMGSVFKVLEVARKNQCAVFVPSSIGAFGETTPRDHTPQDTLQRPSTMYGVTKVAGELLCDYYHLRFGVDTRGLRFPGLISYLAPPGGGTTDYAVEIFHQALRYKHYNCFLEPDTRLDMMYMPDALRACVEIMEADPARLVHRNAFNVTAMNVTPEELAAAIRVHIPEFQIEYKIDPVRQKIANSWPRSLDHSAAQSEWDWAPRYDLPTMVEDMLRNLRHRLEII